MSGGQINAGPCIVCFQGTDTALAFRGSPEWCVAGLVVLGVPGSQATATFKRSYPSLDELMTATYRVCRACVRQADKGLPDPSLTLRGFEIPCLWQPGVAA